MAVKVDVRTGWTRDNEIEWTVFYIAQLERALAYHQHKLAEYRAEQAWWDRFMDYCHTGI